MRFTVSAETLRHVRPFASREESRPILNGVCIESTGVIVATNGHRLLAVAPIGDHANPERAMRVEIANRPNYVGLLMPLRVDQWEPKIAPIPSVIAERPNETA